jgi:hypothetical protein
MNRNTFLATCVAALTLFMGALLGADAKPKTVIHVITIQWKADATPAQIDKAIKAAEALPSQYPGILHVWTRPIKMQLDPPFKHIIVMEFASEDALTKYAGSAAQKKFYDAYMAVREESRTHDITN